MSDIFGQLSLNQWNSLEKFRNTSENVQRYLKRVLEDLEFFEKIFGKSSGMIRNLKKLVFFAVVILTGNTTCILEEPNEKYHTRLMFSHAPTDRPWIFERTTRAITTTGTEIQKNLQSTLEHR